MLIRGGTVIDPSQGLEASRDVRIRGEQVAEVADRLDPAPGEPVLDARGQLVLPGLIDLHVHVFWGVSHYGVEADRHCLERGVTTAVDAGSAGSYTVAALRRYVADAARTRILAFLNVAGTGMISPVVGELRERRHLDAEAIRHALDRERSLLRGVKVRLSRELVGPNGRMALRLALRAADAAAVPVMAHVGDTTLSLSGILAELRPGDLVTHCYHGRSHGALDRRGHVSRAVRAASERGVLFDVGHGRGSFSFAVARRALAEDLRPSTISSDLHVYNVDGPVFDLVSTMSKFLALGLSLGEVVERTTAAPARVLGAFPQLGTLRPGAAADVTLLRLESGRFTFRDSLGEAVVAERRLALAGVVRSGVAVPPASGPTATAR